MLNRTTSLLLSTTLVLSLLTISTDLSAQEIRWERVDRTDEGPIERVEMEDVEIAPDGTPIIFANDGIYLLEGTDGIPSRAIKVDSTLAVSGLDVRGNLVHAVNAQALYRSEDNGRSWQMVIDLEAKAPLPADGDDLFIRDYNRQTIYRLRPDGSQGASYPYPVDIDYVTVSPSGTLYALSQDFRQMPVLHVSYDDGNTWLDIEPTNLSDRESYVTISVLGDSVLALRTGQGFVLSHDGGKSWTDIIPAGSFFKSRFALSNDGTLFRIGPSEVDHEKGEYLDVVYSSADSGTTWDRCRTIESSAFIMDDGTIYADHQGALGIAENCSAPWSALSRGFRNVTASPIYATESSLYAGIRNHDGLFSGTPGQTDYFRSTNDGSTWSEVTTIPQGLLTVLSDETFTLLVDTIVFDTTNVWSRTIQRKKLLVSNDQGSGWTGSLPYLFGPRLERRVEIESAAVQSILVTEIENDYSTLHNYFVSTDGGTSFSVPGGWSDSGSFRPRWMTMLSDGQILAAGSRWEDESTFIDYGFNRLDPTTGTTEWLGGPELGYLKRSDDGTVYGWDEGKLYRSEDDGENWIELTAPSGMELPEEVTERPGALLFARDGTVTMLSRDGGETWSRYQTYRQPGGDTTQLWSPIPSVVLEDGTIYQTVRVDDIDPGRANQSGPGDTRTYRHYTLARSTDGGTTWDLPLGETHAHLDVLSIALSGGNTLVIGTRNNGIYRAVVASSVNGEFEIESIDLDIR